MAQEAFVIHRKCRQPYTQFRTVQMANNYYGRNQDYDIKLFEPRNPLPPAGYRNWCKCKSR